MTTTTAHAYGAAQTQRESSRRNRLRAGLLMLVLFLTVPAIFVATVYGARVHERMRTAPPKIDSALLASYGSPQALVDSDIFTQGRGEFIASCTACHGPNGEALPGLGKDISHSRFVAGLTDEELAAFIKKGRDPSDPLNTTGVGMPAKGGNPALNDEKIEQLVAYIRGLQAIARGEVQTDAAAAAADASG